MDKLMESIIKEKFAKKNKTIYEHNMDLIKQLDTLKELGYINNQRIYDLVRVACTYHDVGKINMEFQRRISSKKKLKFNDKKEVSHNIVSIYFIDKKTFGDNKSYLIVVHAVLNHHDYCDVFEVMSSKKQLIEDLLSDYEHFKILNSTKSKLASIAKDIEAIKVKGYLHKCDYSASGDYICEYKNDFLEESLKKLLNNWKKENEKADWNELQKYCIEKRDENIIVVAQTGMGKTEAGLHWIGDTKGFFILPIRTAINAIYKRIVTEMLNYDDSKEINNYYEKNKKLKIDNKVGILHSNSLEYYCDLYNSDNKTTIDEKEEFDLIKYEEMCKHLSIPLNISTMDQLFDFVYKYKGFELKLTTLSYSKIVIDEIQMYGPDLLAYLIYGLEQIDEFGGKIAILTATMPPFVRDLLKKNIKFASDERKFIDDKVRHNLKIIDDEINTEDILDLYIKNKEEGKSNKVLVICNTVKQVQKIYSDLHGNLPIDINKEEVHILHSKFTKKDRAKKEEEILNFAAASKVNNQNIDVQNGIWVCTSIVEASLDIDFDYLFTELQDLSSLFQRLGRCNRRGLKDNQNYNCYIYTVIDDKLLSKDNSNKDIFIDRTIFNLSKEAISSIDGKISEAQKMDLIEKYLTMDNLKNSSYMRKYNEIYEYIKNIPMYRFKSDNIDLRNILSVDIIPSKVYLEFKGEIDEALSKLKQPNLDIKERLKLKRNIKDFIVSVSPWDLSAYKKSVSSGKAMRFDPVIINKYEIYPVIECNYDDLGYTKIDFNKDIIRKANIL